MRLQFAAFCALMPMSALVCVYAISFSCHYIHTHTHAKLLLSYCDRQCGVVQICLLLAIRLQRITAQPLKSRTFLGYEGAILTPLPCCHIQSVMAIVHVVDGRTE